MGSQFGPRQAPTLDILSDSVRAIGFSLWASFSLLEVGSLLSFSCVA